MDLDRARDFIRENHRAVLATYPSDGALLRSGYLLGDTYLRGKAAALDEKLGDGRVVLLGFRPQWRG